MTKYKSLIMFVVGLLLMTLGCYLSVVASIKLIDSSMNQVFSYQIENKSIIALGIFG